MNRSLMKIKTVFGEIKPKYIVTNCIVPNLKQGGESVLIWAECVNSSLNTKTLNAKMTLICPLTYF